MCDYFLRIRSDLEKHLTIKNWDKHFLRTFQDCYKKTTFLIIKSKKIFVSCRLHISKLDNNNNNNNNDNDNLGIKS